MTEIKLKLFERGSSFGPLCEAVDSKGRAIQRLVAMIQPTEEYDLSQIPKGPNPRDIDPATSIYKAIKNSYKDGACFTARNGGVCAVVDFNSMKIKGDYLTFTCSNTGITGHYDGQHTIAAVQDAIDEKCDEGNAVLLFLISENA